MTKYHIFEAVGGREDTTYDYLGTTEVPNFPRAREEAYKRASPGYKETLIVADKNLNKNVVSK